MESIIVLAPAVLYSTRLNVELLVEFFNETTHSPLNPRFLILKFLCIHFTTNHILIISP